jgi:hypothetical protein
MVLISKFIKTVKNLLGKLLTSSKVLKLEEAGYKQDLLSGAKY